MNRVTRRVLLIVALVGCGVWGVWGAPVLGSHLKVPHQGDAIECGPAPNQAELRGLLAELMRAWVPPRNEQAVLPNADSRGAKLLGKYCAQCHDLPHPRQHVASEWPKVVDRMQDYAYFIGHRTITDKENTAITDFLKSQAR